MKLKEIKNHLFGEKNDNEEITEARLAAWDAFSDEAVRHCGRLAVDRRLGFPMPLDSHRGFPKQKVMQAIELLPSVEAAIYESDPEPLN